MFEIKYIIYVFINIYSFTIVVEYICTIAGYREYSLGSGMKPNKSTE